MIDTFEEVLLIVYLFQRQAFERTWCPDATVWELTGQFPVVAIPSGSAGLWQLTRL